MYTNQLAVVIDAIPDIKESSRTFGDQKYVWKTVAGTWYYTRYPTRGDHKKAFPYKHAKLHVWGSSTEETYDWYGTRLGTQIVYGPNQLFIPGISIHGDGELFVSCPSELVDRVSNKMLLKLQQQKVTLGETLGELCETASFIASKAEHLARLFSDIKHRRWSNALKQLGVRKSYMKKNMESRWLECQFAIKPLFLDLVQYVDLLHEGLGNQTYLIHVKSSAGNSERYTSYTNDNALLMSHVKYNVHGSMSGIVDFATLRALSELGISNPVAILWELLPLSVFVDTMINVGDIIEGFGAPYGTYFYTGSYGHKVVAEGDRHKSTKSYYYPYVYTGSEESYFTAEGFQRYPFYEYPYPKVEFHFPIGKTQWANLAAFIVSLIRN